MKVIENDKLDSGQFNMDNRNHGRRGVFYYHDR